jgi:hypothetical protein
MTRRRKGAGRPPPGAIMPRLQNRPRSLRSDLITFPAPILAVSHNPRVRNAALLVACIIVAGVASLFRGQDANWDLQNYHYYNPWAWWNGRIFTWDIAAAQLQTYLNALLDLPFYAMVTAGWAPRTIAFVLAIPAGIAAFFLAKLLPMLFADLPRVERRVAVIASFAIGVTSAMGIAMLGATMNEWPLVALTLAALWLLVRALVRNPTTPLRWTTLVGAGLLSGFASGAKLTAATFAVGLCVALLLRGPWNRRTFVRAFREAFVFGLGVLAGMMVSLGPWAWQLWTYFDSPIFPFGNQWIKSPWWSEYPALTRKYGPHSLGEWLLFPFNLFNPRAFFVAEVAYRDPRFPVTWALALVAGAAWLTHRAGGNPPVPVHPGVSAGWRLLSVFFITSFLLSTAQYSTYRFILTLDLLTGALIVTLLQRLLRPGYAAGVIIAVAVTIIAMTRVADWWHIDFGDRWFEVRMPPVDANALVLISTGNPVSFVLPFFPSDARHVAINNTVTAQSRNTKLEDAIVDAIRNHKGPLYQLTVPPMEGSEMLAVHGLARDEPSCAHIRTQMSDGPLELCRLRRLRDPQPH